MDVDHVQALVACVKLFGMVAAVGGMILFRPRFSTYRPRYRAGHAPGHAPRYAPGGAPHSPQDAPGVDRA